MYLFNRQEVGVKFLEGLSFDVGCGTHGMNHIYTAETLEGEPFALVAKNGEVCLVDEWKSHLKKYHDIIRSAWNERFRS